MMLTTDPEKRPSAQELLDCSWFNDQEFDAFKDIEEDLQTLVKSRSLRNVAASSPWRII
jgi:hypothetical protein